jgi:hypothetical protein
VKDWCKKARDIRTAFESLKPTDGSTSPNPRGRPIWTSRLVIVSRVRSALSSGDSSRGRTSAARASHRTERSRARTVQAPAELNEPPALRPPRQLPPEVGNALFDSRDGPINPSRGVYASLAYRAFFEGFLGGATSWQELSYDGRSYLRLSRDARHRLAFWLSGHFVVGGRAPYLDLPATGMDTYGRAGRGYPQGRFRGERLVYGEAEYRWTATRNGLFGMVAFLNAQTFGSEETGESLFDAFAPGAGLGLRLMLNKRSQTNLCLDIGWGEDGSRAVYFAVQEAF